ncbi:beta-lactamase/transpeptidase-like protein [Hyaloraphidium curvatum]|nr:beta-lactamase/transpeptidase-like protein [Hyaloraphidium curvatum]
MAPAIEGTVAPGFEAVRDVLSESLAAGSDIGASVAVFYKNKLVVDIAGGFQDAEKSRPYTRSTVNIVHSSGKVPESLAVLQAISQGRLGFDDAIASLWPEFAVRGKETVTIRDMLEHQGGLPTLEGDFAPEPAELADLDALAKRVEGAPHLFGGKVTKAYHGITRGFFLNELLRRTHPERKSFGQLLSSEWCPKLGISFYCGLPDQVRDSPDFCHPICESDYLEQHAGWMVKQALDAPLAVRILQPLAKLADVDPAAGKIWSHSPAFLRGESPSASCVGNAKALATMVNCLTGSNKGTTNGYRILNEDTWAKAIQVEERNREQVDIMLGSPFDTTWGGFGWNTPGTIVRGRAVDFSTSPPTAYTPDWALGEGWRWVGWGGAGGSVVIAAPDRDVAVAYVPNLLKKNKDERAMRITAAVARCVDLLEGKS